MIKFWSEFKQNFPVTVMSQPQFLQHRQIKAFSPRILLGVMSALDLVKLYGACSGKST